MQTVSLKKKQVAQAIGALVLGLGTTQAIGTGFQLNEQSGSGLGNAFAAGAAYTDDVSAMWSNPAALSLFPKPQAAMGFNVITPSIKFSNNASVMATNQPLGNNGGDAGGYNYTPIVYLAMPINPQWAFGLGINVPFGLVTEYDDGWIGRYQGLKSKIETLNVNPGDLVEDHPAVRGRIRRQLPASQGDADSKHQLLGCAAAGRRGQWHRTRLRHLHRYPGLDPWARFEGDDHCR
jgi:hypothetical protein